MITLDPSGTLQRSALLAVGSGILWALLAVWLIFVGATLLPPRLSVKEIWPEWRRKRMIWAGSLIATVLGAAWTAEWLLRNVALKDLFWLNRVRDMGLICRTGVGTGYLLVLALFTVGALLRKRARRSG